jgi:hypothetical protein
MSKEQFHELSDYIIEYFDELEKKLSLPVDIKYVYQADDKQKTLIKIVKIADRYTKLLNADLLISFNEDFFDAFDDEAKNILIDQELALIEFNLDKGTLKLGKPDLISSSGVIKKYGLSAVERANQVKELFNNQQLEQEKENKENKKNKK